MKFRILAIGLLSSTAIAGFATGASAQAQAQAPAQAQAQAASQGLLGEVVVTATRRADTVSKVALSITAVTPKDIDQQGLKTIDDLSRIAPALTIRRGLDNQVTIAVRGIIASAGAQTTGVYLDDVPMAKRIVIGASTGNGNPSPPLFDLERVEVLRGPQGTLYGGSSEGGTIRFITPTPSLTTYSTYARGEVSTTNGGSGSYEAGVAAGGPIIADKLGFRASVFDRHDGGWIDHLNVYTGAAGAQNTNWQDTRAFRLTALWAATPDLKVTPGLYYSYNYINDGDQYYEGFPKFTLPTVTTGTYVYPAHTYGPLTLNTSTTLTGTRQFRTQTAFIPSLSLDYNFKGVNVKSVTAYLGDEAKGESDSPFNEPGVLLGGTGLVSELPNFAQHFAYKNKRRAITEELRISSLDQDARLTWVGGLFFNHSITSAAYVITEDLDSLTAIVLNQTVTQRYKTPTLPGGVAGTRLQTDTDQDLAGFGEATFKITDKLKAIAGVRVTATEFRFEGTYVGPLTGIGVATVANGGLTTGGVKETPVTPKAGLQYQINNADMVYFTAAKGYRPGGVNTPVPLVSCAAGLAAYGGTPPQTYNSDTVMSYELGGKFRFLDNRLALNASGYHIDWSNVQVSLGLPGCTFNFTANAANAVSQGFDLQTTMRVLGGFTVSAAVGYDDAHYVNKLQGPPSATGARTLLINAGDQLPISPWTVDLTPQFDFELADLPAFLRADYQFASAFHRTYSVGTSTFNPDIFPGNSTTLFNARAGIHWHSTDFAIFANNLLNSADLLSRAGGPTGCGVDPACAAPSSYNRLHIDYSYRPRTIGIQIAYRH